MVTLEVLDHDHPATAAAGSEVALLLTFRPLEIPLVLTEAGQCQSAATSLGHMLECLSAAHWLRPVCLAPAVSAALQLQSFCFVSPYLTVPSHALARHHTLTAKLCAVLLLWIHTQSCTPVSMRLRRFGNLSSKLERCLEPLEECNMTAHQFVDSSIGITLHKVGLQTAHGRSIALPNPVCMH